MAGLAAARSLADAGWPVRVIEARDRIGGRVHTNRDWGVPLEMGASWIQGTTDNPLTELARQAQAQTVATDYDEVAKLAVDPRLQPLDYDRKAWRRFVERARDEVDGGSLGAAVDAAATSEDLPVPSAPSWPTTSTPRSRTNTRRRDQLSAMTFDTATTPAASRPLSPTATTPCQRLLANGLPIALNTPVTAIMRRDDSVIVRAKNRSFDGPAAIVTVPLGVLKSGAISFDPPLPEGHAHAVNALGFGVLSKSFFRFDRRTWQDENAFYQYIGPSGGLWAQWFTMPTAAGPIVLAFNAGERGRSVESSSPENLIASALPIARQLFGNDTSPVEVRTSSWTTDPYALGAYSFHAPGSGLDDRRRLQEPISDRLYLAGEADRRQQPRHRERRSAQWAIRRRRTDAPIGVDGPAFSVVLQQD